MNNGIRISYPRTKYLKLNNCIMERIKAIINEFMMYAKEAIQENFTYTLDVSFDEYEYSNYLSFVFYVSMYTGGAHPDNRIFTINYNIDSDHIITIDDLVKEHVDFLEKLSQQSRDILLKNSSITNQDILIEGTSSKEENFKNFAFSTAGFTLLFPQYQVAPYSSGSFKIVIPYENLMIK